MAALLGNQHDKGEKKKPAAPTAGSSDGSLNSSVFWSAWGWGGKGWVDWGGSGLEKLVFPECAKVRRLRKAEEKPEACWGVWVEGRW